MAKYKLKDGSYTDNIIETWLDKTKEELAAMQEAGLLPPYVQEALADKKPSQNPEKSPKQPESKKPRRKAKAATVGESK